MIPDVKNVSSHIILNHIADADRLHTEELLADMHEKLSEAVKLYDKLLTEQVSHPSWRAAASPIPVAATYQQTPTASYGQWSIPPQQAAASQTPSSYLSSPPATADRQPPTATASYGTSPAPNLVSVPLQSPRTEFTQQQPYMVTSPPPVAVSQYQTPFPHSAEVHAPSVSIQPSLQYQSSPYGAQVNQQLAPSPSAIVASPPPLSRHNTVVSHSPAPPLAQAKPLVRSSTVSYSHTPQQLQQLQQTHVPQPLPNLPAAPTAPPQAYDSYVTPRQEPQREALLIDL